MNLFLVFFKHHNLNSCQGFWGPGMVEHNMKTNMRRESFLKLKVVLILGAFRDFFR